MIDEFSGGGAMALRRGDLRIMRGTTVHGPVTRDQLAGLVAAGRVAGTDLVSVAEGPWGPVTAYLGDSSRLEVDSPVTGCVTDNDESSSSRWHYSRGGSQFGPVSSGRLKELAASGELMSTDLVWKEGLPDWRPAGTLKGLFPEVGVKSTGPPPLPKGKTAARVETPSAASPDAVPVATPPGEPGEPPARPEPDFFDRARSLTQKAKAKAEAFREQARTNPNAARVAIKRSAKAAADYARSDEARDLARKAHDAVVGGAMAATALAGAATAEGRGRGKKMAEHPLGVGAALLGFFPLGLYLVWHHPHWMQARKLAWTGASLGVFFLMMMPVLLAPRMRVTGPSSVGLSKMLTTTPPSTESTTASGSGSLSHSSLPAYEDHPPPIIESVSNGAEVWLLNDCHPNTLKPSAGERAALYIVFSGDDLAYVVVKQYCPPGPVSESILGTRDGGAYWGKYPDGESKSGNLIHAWTGRKHKGGDFDEGADESMLLRYVQDFRSTVINSSGSHVENSSGALISLRRYGEEIRWKLEASSSSSSSFVGGKKGKLPPRVNSRKDSGFGRLLKFTDSDVRGASKSQAGKLVHPIDGTGPHGGPPGTLGLTADELRGKIVGEDFRPKRTFFDRYGEPNRVVDVGDKTYLHYTCKDGRVVIECPKGPYQYDDDLAPLSVDRQ